DQSTAEVFLKAGDNKVAVVSGRAGGIGSAIARRFARECAHLSLVDIDADADKTIATELTAKKTDVITVVADVTNKQSVQEMVQTTLNRWGRIDILVNVAGGADRKLVVDMTADDWDRIIDMNLKSVFLCSQAVLP